MQSIAMLLKKSFSMHWKGKTMHNCKADVPPPAEVRSLFGFEHIGSSSSSVLQPPSSSLMNINTLHLYMLWKQPGIHSFGKHYFPKLCFPGCIFSSCIFATCIFPSCTASLLIFDEYWCPQNISCSAPFLCIIAKWRRTKSWYLRNLHTGQEGW